MEPRVRRLADRSERAVAAKEASTDMGETARGFYPSVNEGLFV
jgi:hypothetical protein